MNISTKPMTTMLNMMSEPRYMMPSMNKNRPINPPEVLFSSVSVTNSILNLTKNIVNPITATKLIHPTILNMSPTTILCVYYYI